MDDTRNRPDLEWTVPVEGLEKYKVTPEWIQTTAWRCKTCGDRMRFNPWDTIMVGCLGCGIATYMREEYFLPAPNPVPVGTEDRVRVLRILEDEGPRKKIEETLSRSVQGTRIWGESRVTGVTLGGFPQLIGDLTTERDKALAREEDLGKRLNETLEMVAGLEKELKVARGRLNDAQELFGSERER